MKEEEQIADYTITDADLDDSQLYFSPERGNVVYSSAVDG